MPKGSKKADKALKTSKPEPKVAPATKPVSGDREIVYPDLEARWCVGPNGVDYKLAEELLGWTEDPDEAAKLGLGAPLLTYKSYFDNPTGVMKKVWLKNDVENRPFYMSNSMALMQEQLNKRWAGPNGSGPPTPDNPDGDSPNPEPIIISRTGQVHNGQHQLVAVKLGQNELIGPDKYHWETVWPEGVLRVDKLIVFGISDSDRVINTMDTCKPRSLADVIFRSPFFKTRVNAQGKEEEVPAKDRQSASTMLDRAVKLLWERLGIKRDPWTPRRTHAEAVDFVNNHKRLLECVSHILMVSRGTAFAKFCPPGHAAGLMFLMAAKATDPDVYHTADLLTEDNIDFEMWDKACEFWKALADGAALAKVRDTIAWLADEDTGGGVRLEEKEAVLIKAWLAFSEGKPVTEAAVKLAYETNDETGISRIKNLPTCGGIDLGKPKDAFEIEEEPGDDDNDEAGSDEVPEGDDHGSDDVVDETDDADEPVDEEPAPPAPKAASKNSKLTTTAPFSDEERAALLSHIKNKPTPPADKPAKGKKNK